jgi:putative flippase GtrA
MSLQFSFFLLSGALASLLNWSSRFLFSQFFNFQISIVLAFIVGLLSGFILMRLFVFKKSQNSIKSQALRYLIINMLALAQTFAVSVLMLNVLVRFIEDKAVSEAISHAMGIVVPVFTSYLGHKHFSFR